MKKEMPVAGLNFECQKKEHLNAPQEAGVFLVCCKHENDYRIVAVEQCDDLEKGSQQHAKEPCGQDACEANLWICFYPMPLDRFTESDRILEIEKIKATYSG